MICYLFKANSADSNEKFRKRCREWKWKMALSSCQRQRLFTDVTSDTGTSFSLSRRWAWFWDVWRHQMAQRYFKIKAFLWLIYRYYISIPIVKSTDETRRIIWKVCNKKVIEFILWNIRHSFLWRRCTRKLVRPSHMNSCRIFHDINSITYKYVSLYASHYSICMYFFISAALLLCW